MNQHKISYQKQKRLRELEVGQRAKVVGYCSTSTTEIIKRFKALGLVFGAETRCDRRLPFLGPLVIRVGGGAFALEGMAADLILIEVKADA